MTRLRLRHLIILGTAILSVSSAGALASDACSRRAVTTAADVKVSDGSSYRTETWFHSPNAAAIRFIRKQGGVYAVEGPFAWTTGEKGSALPPGERRNFVKVFALGHQFHAFLVFFDEVMGETRASEVVAFQGSTHRARTGNYPYGGIVHLIEGKDGAPSPGMRLELEGAPPMEIGFGDWRKVGGRELPFAVRINDGNRIFDYAYTSVEIAQKSPLWFFDAPGAAPPDAVQVYRLHRRLLAAHCLGDAGMIAALSMPKAISADGGAVSIVTRADMKSRFKSLFEALDYTEYRDLAEPVIHVSEDGGTGWAAVKVRARGVRKADNQPFDDQWAWVMLARKIGGKWLHAGNASNRKEK